MSVDEPGDDPTPAERRLGEVLLVLRDDPASDRSLTRRVMHAVRRQRTVRAVFAAVGRLAGALLDAAGAAGFGGQRRRGGQR